MVNNLRRNGNCWNICLRHYQPECQAFSAATERRRWSLVMDWAVALCSDAVPLGERTRRRTLLHRRGVASGIFSGGIITTPDVWSGGFGWWFGVGGLQACVSENAFFWWRITFCVCLCSTSPMAAAIPAALTLPSRGVVPLAWRVLPNRCCTDISETVALPISHY